MPKTNFPGVDGWNEFARAATDPRSSRQPLDYLSSLDYTPKRESKPFQSSIVLCFICSPTRIVHKPGLKASVERRPGSSVAAAVGHDSANHNPFHLFFLQHILQIGIDEGIVGVLRNHGAAGGLRGNLGLEFPILAASGDCTRWAQFSHQLIVEWRSQLVFGMAVLREDAR